MLKELKDNLRIEWNTEDEHLEKVLERAKEKINSLLGSNFTEFKGEYKSLVLDYARYDFHSATHLFEKNFSDTILRCQLKVGIDEL